jgi:hypothetical protein
MLALKAAQYLENRDEQLAKQKAYRIANPEKYNARMLAYRVAHRLEAIARIKAWRLANPERHRKNAKAYRLANLEQSRARSLAWGRADPEKHRARARAWYRANPEAARAAVDNRRARVMGSLGAHSAAEWAAKKKQHRFRCCDCGMREGDIFPEGMAPKFSGKPMKLTKGHAIPLRPIDGSGYKCGSNAISNILPQCLPCNLRQSQKIHPSVLMASLFDIAV